jgi:D-alanyl-D-alanine carboxypeptidase (penicillin-binding protein 5/6)
MRLRRLSALALLVAVLVPSATVAKKDNDKTPKLDFDGKQIKVNLSDEPKGGLLFSPDDGDVLWQEGAHDTRPVASITKLMTALVAVDELDPRDKVKITREAAGQEPVNVGLKPDTRVPAETLLEAALIPSGNDAAVALAEGAGGSTKKFVKDMNRRAKKLDLDCTKFKTPSGLSSSDESCPEDLARLTMEALDEKRIANVVKKRGMKLKIPGRGRVRVVSTNPLHRQHYKGTIGVKTGFTSAAGHCLIAAVKRHGDTLVAVLLDSPDTGGQAEKLIEKGFDELK